jgi:hypothetical protein
MTLTIGADPDQRLAEALMAVIRPAGGPGERALAINRIAEHIVAVVSGDSSMGDRERDSLLNLLEAAVDHCQQMGASPSPPDVGPPTVCGDDADRQAPVSLGATTEAGSRGDPPAAWVRW